MPRVLPNGGPRPPANGEDMASQISAPGPMTQVQRRGNQAGPSLLPVAPDTIFPHPKRIADAANVCYRPVFQNRAKAESFCQYMMSKYDKTDTSTADIPDLDVEGEGHEWIERLHNAVYDFSGILELKEAEYYKKLTKDYYNEGAMHWMLWKLLNCVVEAQHGINLLPPWYTPDGPHYRYYPSFAERFNDVVAGLRESKSTVISLFKNDEFPARLAWNPPKEYKRKVDNLGQNDEKSDWNAVKNEVKKTMGIHRNQKGEFQDKDGNIITGKMSHKTELAVSRSTAFKRRRGSKKATTISKLAPPTKPTGELKLLDPAPIERSQGSKAEAQPKPPIPEEHVDGPSPPPPETSKRRAKGKRKARSKASKGGEERPHPRRGRILSSPPPHGSLDAEAGSVAQASTSLQTALQIHPPEPFASSQQIQMPQQGYMEQQQQHVFQQMPMPPYSYPPFQPQPQMPMADAQYAPPGDAMAQGNNKRRRLEYEPLTHYAPSAPSAWTGYVPHTDAYTYQSEFPAQQLGAQGQLQGYNNFAGQVPDPSDDPFWVPDFFGPQE
ncbi:hypothetical protein F5B22DRAFT_649806 [Xylaria bambusicola]|uniref:uncharacterized protein n=1 Tax=Xylaria bambusicola TaxID=326684 RepID=UPI0020087B5B|nr:uncharacterized protein F5B22DRAFT_649806 [Xylaria bambusicola]KAI0508712.1 hypothetical protein F5B22DRAFT_649806 [Xylaria bambusicola]